MTPIISYLIPSIALSLLDIQELFGRGYDLNFNQKDGFLISDEVIGVQMNDKNFTVPILKSDLLHTKLFIDDLEFPELSGSVYGLNKTFAVGLSGPQQKIQREVSVFNIDASLWVKQGTKTEDFVEISLETMNSSHVFRGIPVVESFVNQVQFVLNPSWKNVLKSTVTVKIEQSKDKPGQDYFSGKTLITENDIRFAILKKQKINLKKIVKITPSALEMGNSAHVFY